MRRRHRPLVWPYIGMRNALAQIIAYVYRQNFVQFGGRKPNSLNHKENLPTWLRNTLVGSGLEVRLSVCDSNCLTRLSAVARPFCYIRLVSRLVSRIYQI